MTLDLPDDSPALSLPWIITFGPADDEEEWEPVVCGPYERAHALALAEEVVADEDLMAVVEPVLPHVDVDAIRAEIANARALAAEEAAAEEDDDDADSDSDVMLVDDADEAFDDYGEEEGDDGVDEDADDEERPATPTPEELRAGFARIAERLTHPPASWPGA